MNQEIVRIVIADDHPGIRRGVRAALKKIPEIMVVGEAANGQEAVDIIEELSPDMLILDLHMPVMDGIEVIEKLNQSGLKVRILVLSAMGDPWVVNEVLLMGVCEFIDKGDIADLLSAVRQAIKGSCHNGRDRPDVKQLARVF